MNDDIELKKGIHARLFSRSGYKQIAGEIIFFEDLEFSPETINMCYQTHIYKNGWRINFSLGKTTDYLYEVCVRETAQIVKFRDIDKMMEFVNKIGE